MPRTTIMNHFFFVSLLQHVYLSFQSHQPSTLLDLAGPSSANTTASSTDPWGLPTAQVQPSTDPWGSPLPPPQSSSNSAVRGVPDPWGSSSGASGGAAPAVTDPWGMPVSKAAGPGAGEIYVYRDNL